MADSAGSMGSTRTAFAPFLIAAALLAAIPASAEEPGVVVGASLWPPYADERLPGQGLALSIVAAALERAGYEPSVELGEWEHTLERGRQGEIAIAAVWGTPEREKDFFLSAPYLENVLKLLERREDAIEVEGLEDLDGLRVGIVAGYAYGKAFDEATGFEKVSETHVLANLLQLTSGRVDVVVGDERTLRYELARHLPDDRDEIVVLPVVVATRPLHFAVSRRHPQGEKLVSDFDRAVAELREDGTIRKLSRQANEEIWRQSYMPH